MGILKYCVTVLQDSGQWGSFGTLPHYDGQWARGSVVTLPLRTRQQAMWTLQRTGPSKVAGAGGSFNTLPHY